MRASYPRAIEWLAFNEDCSWLLEDAVALPVSVCLVVDLWDKPARVVVADILKFRSRNGLANAR